LGVQGGLCIAVISTLSLLRGPLYALRRLQTNPPNKRPLEVGRKEDHMFEAPAIIGTCINCIAPGSLSATLALVLIGAAIALTAERRKPVPAKTQAAPIQSN
jgi:hypothetical protein